MFITTMVLRVERTNSIATISPYSNNVAMIIENEWMIEVYNIDKSTYTYRTKYGQLQK